MGEKNAKSLLAYMGLLGAITFAGTLQPRLPGHYGSRIPAVPREFASLSWTDGTVWGHVNVRTGEAVPEGSAFLYYQILRRDGRVVSQGRGYIPQEDLTRIDENTLFLKSDTQANPLLKKKGLEGVIDLRWDSAETDSDTGETASASVEGVVYDFDLEQVKTAFMDGPESACRSR